MRLYVFENVCSDQSEFALNKLKEKLREDFGYDNVEIIKNEYGKPYLINSEYYFNISHSKDIVVIVISDKEIGVDVELYGHFAPSLINKFCSQEEIEEIKSSENENVEFIKNWCMKESLLKCKGMGLKLNMKNVLDEKDNYSFSFYRGDKYFISICEKKG